MELRHLRYFIAVAEELHFARAAERLHIEQSPVSRAIKELEYDLGVQLFEGTTRSTRLTWAGQVFLGDVRRVFLLDAVAPGGTLLVVETSDMMASLRAGDRRRKLASGHRAWVLRLWARARLGTRAVDIEALCPNEYVVQRHALLGGLVNAWLVRREIGHDSAVPTRGQWPAADE